MDPVYTTHLMCSPELFKPFILSKIYIQPGQLVNKDDLLVTLSNYTDDIHINAIEDGKISNLFVSIGDDINTGDLLLIMEVEELPTGFLNLDKLDNDNDNDITNNTSKSLMIMPSAEKLAIRLGVDISLIKQNNLTGYIDDEDVEIFVKNELLKLKQLRFLLS
ncbi:biotin/lipoyl-containing protein [uncultured Deefgea sp.]|uniref:biotin/lipoyl-containing protein n=1 Tax=uncultured Deefgea sp. TaxID=1304914 RepID=UPI00263033BB|nr:biotin/lipoyl-containing protein [uncultured Deefgea sp.]